MTEDAPQRSHSLRQVFNGLRWIVLAGASWRMIPNNLLLEEIVFQQTERWSRAGVFKALVHDLRELLRVAEGRQARPRWRSSTAARCNLRWKARSAQATAGRSGERVAGRTLPLTHSATYWR